jgi:hypothetical protein
MDITRDNFAEVLPELMQRIERAEFISFDLEMTGIFNNDPGLRNRRDDTPSYRYEKMSEPVLFSKRYSI